MRIKEMPKFRRLDLVELQFKDEPLGKGLESSIGYIVSTGTERGFGETIEICTRIAGKYAVEPEKILLKDVKRVIVYGRKE